MVALAAVGAAVVEIEAAEDTCSIQQVGCVQKAIAIVEKDSLELSVADILESEWEQYLEHLMRVDNVETLEMK